VAEKGRKPRITSGRVKEKTRVGGEGRGIDNE
jgi:hypothetical protein